MQISSTSRECWPIDQSSVILSHWWYDEERPQISEALKQWKVEKEKGNPLVASEEAARRYYSVKEFLKSGVENVFKPIPPPKEDKKFWILSDMFILSPLCAAKIISIHSHHDTNTIFYMLDLQTTFDLIVQNC